MNGEQLTADNAAALPTRLSKGVWEESVPGYVIKLARLVQLAKVITTAVAVIAGLLTASGTAAAGESPADFIRDPVRHHGAAVATGFVVPHHRVNNCSGALRRSRTCADAMARL